MAKYRVTQADGVTYEMGAASEEALKGMLARKGVRVTGVELIEGGAPAPDGGFGFDSSETEGMSAEQRVRYMEAKAAALHAAKPRASGLSVAKTVILVWWILSLLGGLVVGAALAGDGSASEDMRSGGWVMIVFSVILGVATAVVLIRRDRNAR